MSNIRLASTILLARDYNGELEVLLLKRNKALAFAGGLWVFPGGKIEPEELAASEDELAAAKLAAVRETKEEADLDIDVDGLIFFRHWTTPVIEPRRYATYFFFGGVNDVSTKVTVDDSEIKKHLWVNPQKAIDKLKEGGLAMMPPTLMSLQLISKCKSVKEVEQLLSQAEPIFILPTLQMNDGKMVCMYKGDAGYPTASPNTIGARHRLVLDFKTGDFTFEYNGCDEVLPVNGGMHI